MTSTKQTETPSPTLLEILTGQSVVTHPRIGQPRVGEYTYGSMTIPQILKAIYLDVNVGLRDEETGQALDSRMQAIDMNKLANSYFHLWQHISIQHEINTTRWQRADKWEPVLSPIDQVARQAGLTNRILKDLYRGEGTAPDLYKLLRWYSFQLPAKPSNQLFAIVAVMSSPILIVHVYELMTTNPTGLLEQRDALYDKLTR